MQEVTFDQVDENSGLSPRFHFVVVALYHDVDTAHAVAGRLPEAGIDPEAVSVIVSEGKLKESLEAGVCIIPPAEFMGVEQRAAVFGALTGGAAGLLLGTEILLLAAGAVFALPALAGMVLLGAAVGATGGATFAYMDLNMEGTGYRIHLHQGGVLLVVYAANSAEADNVADLLYQTHPTEIGKHPIKQYTVPS